MVAAEWKQKEMTSWNILLSDRGKVTQELNKPYSYGLLWTFVYRRNFDICLRMMHNAVKGRRVLNIGCGSGWLEEWLSRAGAFPIGVDTSLEFVKIAKKRMKKGFLADFLIADGEHLPFRTDSFSNVITYQSLHHFPQPYKVISEALRVSRFLLLADEPSTSPLPKPFHKILKVLVFSRLNVGEASGIEEVRFDPEKMMRLYMRKGYEVRLERVWSIVPSIFVKLERSKTIRKIFVVTNLLMHSKMLRRFGHGFMMTIEKIDSTYTL